MAKQAVFSMKLKPDLRADFMAAALPARTGRHRRPYVSWCAAILQKAVEAAFAHQCQQKLATRAW